MDAYLLDFVIQQRNEAATPWVVALTTATRPAFVMVAALVASAMLMLKRRALPLFPAVAVGLAWISSSALKYLCGRERPSRELQLLYEYNPSFPSGHATTAFAAATILALLCRRWWVVTAWIMAAAVALSRLVRGVHWPSDVLAGALLGAGVVAATYAVMRKTAAARTH
ncbi:Membrane-associated phospholipid phosphatase [Corynebacterium pseudotuberculosis]|uniref:phosphatase PAP2 family protein n=1 Tax=Corynebacterium pseudotuberculosis TaxID=1719 RepID=UPI000C1CC6A1|nr:phosphatase PAP2 family protein [Corynebacterium pseudotuberculosis]ATV80198.1 Membrane-associated phospholipid phosphatase [Corynebacterium pseudotuberculosis]